MALSLWIAGLAGTNARSQGNSSANALDSLPAFSANEPTMPLVLPTGAGFNAGKGIGPAKDRARLSGAFPGEDA
ncbi:hypothetical protein C7I87_25790 [Mesorhizobium sp. SARCC-RB16n]|nr:hypothetical protein C7I87_25790 [Mesorhizobium sp. SARCC-RB16n]